MKLNKQLPNSYMNQFLKKVDKVENDINKLNSNLDDQNKNINEQNTNLDLIGARLALLEEKYGSFTPIESLSGSVSGSMSAYGSSGTVVFSTPFFNVPTVTASLKASETYINYSIGTVTRSGFTYTVYSSQHSSCSYTLSWIAEAEY